MLRRVRFTDEAMSDTDRKYTEEEFALILRKAAEIQDGPGGADVGAGISLDEIRTIAREVGIEVAAVDRAAALLPRAASRGALARIMGGPTSYRLESEVRGAVGEADLPRILDAVRRAADHHGRVEYGPGGFEWSTVGEVSRIHVTTLPAENGTHIRVTADRNGASVVTFFFNLLGWMVAAGITGAVVDPDSAAVGAAILSGGVLGGLVQGRVVWAWTTKTIRGKLQRIMTAVTGAAEGLLPSEQDPEAEAEVGSAVVLLAADGVREVGHEGIASHDPQHHPTPQQELDADAGPATHRGPRDGLDGNNAADAG